MQDRKEPTDLYEDEVRTPEKPQAETSTGSTQNNSEEDKEDSEENKISTGNEVLDDMIGGFEKDIITTIYGPAGSGKTNFCILGVVEVARGGKKIIYVDTDGSFSIERLKQIDEKYKETLQNIIFFRPTSFKEQKITFENLDKITNDKIGLIVVDSIAMLYRLELGNEKDVFDVNRELGKQITKLTKIARKEKIPVLITNQVYSTLDEKDRVKMVGGNFMKYGSKCLIEIQEEDNHKKVILRRHRSQPKGKELFFEIDNQGVKKVKKEDNKHELERSDGEN